MTMLPFTVCWKIPLLVFSLSLVQVMLGSGFPDDWQVIMTESEELELTIVIRGEIAVFGETTAINNH